ncbi:uncharacterized protein EDB93DRAFT_1107518 [Suillus bovinus]|uniref:uncharacterized protein n=1 Tax=Suillus bovinus TaxID=48563 RepID=UPI001B860B58|nr:uncharacterized protein EDB93DRAFT_1107518 [Suillus bovinus]KAG2133684.1 hypothetical protein EDB93DRAFT_1107518 [Suillus bovinus]
MGRPHLHHSPEEQAKAARAYRHSYYQRNREQFCPKNKEHHCQCKCSSSSHSRSQDHVNNEDADEISESNQIHQPHLGPPERLTSESEPPIHNLRYKSPTSHIKNCLVIFLGGPDIKIYNYLDIICLTLLKCMDNTLDIEDIIPSIRKLERLEKDARAEEAGILQYYGVGPKLVQVQGIGKEVHHLLSALEEVFIYGLTSITELAVMYDGGELLFQSQ